MISRVACRHLGLEQLLGQVWLHGCSMDRLPTPATGDGSPAHALSCFPARSVLVCGGTFRKMSRTSLK